MKEKGSRLCRLGVWVGDRKEGRVIGAEEEKVGQGGMGIVVYSKGLSHLGDGKAGGIKL